MQQVMKQTQMPNDVCAHVWELTNPEGSEIFTKPMFLMAMHLMYKKKKDNKKKLANKDVAEKPWLEFTKSKGASSDLTSIVFADDMKPNTGIYRWTVAFGAGRSFVGVTSQHGKNSHEFLGNISSTSLRF